MEDKRILPHRVVLDQRSALTVTGVSEVLSFDENTVLVQTELGNLVIQGQGLQLKALTPENGQVAVAGTVSALVYEEARARGGWVRRLLG